MPRKSISKNRPDKKVFKAVFKAVIFVLILVFLFFYLAVSLSPKSKFNYEVVPQNGLGATKYFIYEPLIGFSSGAPLNITFLIKPREIEKSALDPITKIELVLSSQLENSSASISYDGKEFAPVSAEIQDAGGKKFQTFHLPLPSEDKTVKVVIRGNYPAEYDKNLVYVHAVQRTYFLTEKRDRFLGEQTQSLRN